LHIHIVGVLLLAQITPLADLSRVSLIFFQFISLSHYTVPLLQRQYRNTRKKLKFNKMLSILVDNAAANEQ